MSARSVWIGIATGEETGDGTVIAARVNNVSNATLPRPTGHRLQAPSEEAPAPTAAASAEDAAVTEASAAPATNGSAPAPTGEREERERRGRRSRRRRRGGHGFPDSKYASDSARPAAPPEAAAVESQTVSQEPEEEVEVEAAVEPTTSPAWAPPSAAPIVLPGESLAKYRHAAPTEHPVEQAPQAAAPVSPVVETVEENGLAENEFDEPIHYPPENALPDAPLHKRTVEPDLAEVPAEPSVLMAEAAAEEADAVEFLPETLESAEISEHLADDSEDQPAVAPLLDDDEDSDIQAMILGDVEGIEIAPSGDGTATGEATSESGSASVRERGGRFPHRVSRRRRRGRGQGSQGSQGPQGAPEQSDRTRPEAGSPEQGHPEMARGESNGAAAVREEQPRQERQPRPEHTGSRPNQGQPSISDLLKEGQEIIVQIAKEPLGQKGARITSHIALPGRYVVYMPTLEHMGVSRKIASDEERLRLKRILQGKRPGPVGGFITRTAAEGRTEEEIAGDMLFLYNLWQDIRTKAEKKPAPAMLHHDLDIVQRILRDQLADSFKAIWIDNEETYESVLRFVERFQPALVPKVKLYTREAPIFDAFSITKELEKALRPKVWLKSGGYIVINQTEALVAIDVNTGKYVGKSNRLEDTIVKTNTEAIKEIVRQIRLRDLGGIIVIDFIDMDERKNRQKVMQTLEEAMRVDRAPYKILQFNDFGLVAITRKRVKQSLERTLCAPCPHCEGAGYVKSADGGERDPDRSPQAIAQHRRQRRDAAGASGRRQGAQVAPEQIPGGARRDSAAPGAGEERSAAASREVRPGVINSEQRRWRWSRGRRPLPPSPRGDSADVPRRCCCPPPAASCRNLAPLRSLNPVLGTPNTFSPHWRDFPRASCCNRRRPRCRCGLPR